LDLGYNFNRKMPTRGDGCYPSLILIEEGGGYEQIR